MTTQHTIAESPPSATALTPQQVEAKVRGWMTAGLPEGRISWPALRGHYVRIHVASPGEVIIWAAALDADVEVSAASVKTWPVFPAALRGWDIQVWCAAPSVPDALRISVRGDR